MPQDAEVEHTALNQYKVFTFFKASLTDEHLEDIFRKYDPRKIKILQISDSKITPQLLSQLPIVLNELPLNSVTDLQGNDLAIDLFFKNFVFQNLEPAFLTKI